MAINSGNKGKTYELYVAKRLSKWAGFKLIRTPMSGAWQGTSGDIKPKDSSIDFPFTVECKKTENWKFEQIMSGVGPFFDWVEQAEREAVIDGHNCHSARWPIVIFSRNYEKDYIAFPYFNTLNWNYAFRQYAIVDIGGFEYFVADLDQFFESFTYNEFRLAITHAYWLETGPIWLNPPDDL